MVIVVVVEEEAEEKGEEEEEEAVSVLGWIWLRLKDEAFFNQ